MIYLYLFGTCFHFIYVFMIIENKTKVINLNVDRIVLSGTWFDSGITSNRPTNVLVGFQYFDSTLSKPIYYKGNNEWVDATGATV